MPNLRPDPDHDAVLDCQARHLVVTAPPGTGKTCLSVRVAAQLVPTLPPGARVLLLTFSTQARTQIEREAARQLPPDLRGKVDVTNYHRFFWQAVRAFRRALALPMRLDIGSRNRREVALARANPAAVKQLRRRQGLIESLAEHAFKEFRDSRTPDEATLTQLLSVVEEEQRAGRLVFDDLGALFWQLLEQFPVVADTYRERYPVVIADEHQDASALQDAVVRRLAGERLVIFADPMQLIHEFRGASQERLDRHLEQCDNHLTLRTPHRWHGSEELANWLVAVRSCLEGGRRPTGTPPQFRIVYTPAGYGFNGMKASVKLAVSAAFREGARTVAVLARANDQVAALRVYLSGQGQHPRQVGTEDFEEARIDIEQLPLLTDPQRIASQAVERLRALVPTLSHAVIRQVTQRLGPIAVDLRQAGQEARGILRALEPIYKDGAGQYFSSLVAALEACAMVGHHLPRIEAVGALRSTAAALVGEDVDLDMALRRYSDDVVAATYVAPRLEGGLFVMTAHQAKGKEFDVVILADATERFWPNDDDTRRLFYVVITRATSGWTIVAPDSGASLLLTCVTAR